MFAQRRSNSFWRVAHNSLAMKMNIKRRGMKPDTRCPVCWRFDEDGGHCFLKCKAVRRCWTDLHLEDTQTLVMQACSAKDFVNDIMKLEQHKRSIVVILLWKWWDKINAGEAQRPCSKIVKAVLSSFTEQHFITRSISSSTEKIVPTWKPPNMGWLKVNIDGAFKNETKMVLGASWQEMQQGILC